MGKQNRSNQCLGAVCPWGAQENLRVTCESPAGSLAVTCEPLANCLHNLRVLASHLLSVILGLKSSPSVFLYAPQNPDQRIKRNKIRCIRSILGTQQEQDFHLLTLKPPEFPAAQPRATRENRANTWSEKPQSNLWCLIWRSRVPQRVDSSWHNLFRVLQTYDRTQDERLKPGGRDKNDLFSTLQG